ncbi:ABC transporter permease [Sciscionella marina]|uniref:ABC transporter permease n=1 Tax=Sciscionella marina TaxID=508770 RepID=UPI0003A4B8E3|nr:ABC transporter permease [Sciscionella marina]
MTIALFLLRRLGGMVVLLLVLSLLVFGLLALSPVSELTTLLGTQPSTPEAVQAITAEYHLNDPFLVQYWHWLVDALHGNFGQSIQSGEPVGSVIVSHLPVTLELALYAGLLVLVLGVPVGMAAGIRRGRVFDRGVSGLTIVGMSAPGFSLGILLIYVFGVALNWFPVFGPGGDQAADRVAHLTLPSIALAAGLIALIVRQTRAATMHVMEQDYVTFARARGISRPRIMVSYALRNTGLPIVTAAGLQLIVAISGTVLVESVFSIPGAGQLMVQSIQSADIPVVQGLSFFVALLVMVVNLIVDVAVLIIDPRTRAAARG